MLLKLVEGVGPELLLVAEDKDFRTHYLIVVGNVFLSTTLITARNLLFRPFRILGTLGPGKEGVQGGGRGR